MKILWAKIDFLHPTNRGGQIRTLEMLRHLRRRNEIHYVAYDDPSHPEGRERAPEYCFRAFPVNRPIPDRGSPPFLLQLAANVFSPLPLAVGRYRSRAMRRELGRLIEREPYDALVADFLSAAPNFPDLSRCFLFQHNVETAIWQRHAAHASSLPRRLYFSSQARRMARYERRACLEAKHVVSVSPADSESLRRLFGVQRVSDIPTGVDLDYFRRPDRSPPGAEIVFVGAMDWMPNIDGARWFMHEIMPRVRQVRPATTLAFAGRNPASEILRYAQDIPLVRVTGTVPDIRPFLWGAKLSIVPLRIGGGTRLKIYEAMAAGTPVVSTPVGAEGLAVTHGRDIAIAADPGDFARAILQLLDNPRERENLADNALELVTNSFGWESVARRFEDILVSAPKR